MRVLIKPLFYLVFVERAWLFLLHKAVSCLLSGSSWVLGGLYFVCTDVQKVFMVVSTYSWGKGLRDSTLKIFVLHSFCGNCFWMILSGRSGRAWPSGGPGVRRGRGLPGAGHRQLWHQASGWHARAGTPLGTAGGPRQGKDTENHGAVEEKQQEARWSGRKKPMRTQPRPSAPPLTSPEGLGTGWMSPRQKTGQPETRKGGHDSGNVLKLSLEKEEEEGLFISLFNYLYSLFANTWSSD